MASDKTNETTDQKIWNKILEEDDELRNAVEEWNVSNTADHAVLSEVLNSSLRKTKKNYILPSRSSAPFTLGDQLALLPEEEELAKYGVNLSQGTVIKSSELTASINDLWAFAQFSPALQAAMHHNIRDVMVHWHDLYDRFILVKANHNEHESILYSWGLLPESAFEEKPKEVSPMTLENALFLELEANEGLAITIRGSQVIVRVIAHYPKSDVYYSLVFDMLGTFYGGVTKEQNLDKTVIQILSNAKIIRPKRK